MSNWYTAVQVTATNGSAIVRVVSAEPINAIRPHDSLIIGSFTGRDILQVYTEAITLDQIIELVLPWDEVTQTLQPARVQPTSVNFNVAADALTTTNTKISSNYAPLLAFGNQASGTVTFAGVGVENTDVTVRCINQWDTDLTALENQAQGSVDDVNAIDDQINNPTTGLQVQVDTIDGTLQGYVASADADATKAQEYAVQPYSTVVTNTTDYSSLHHATDSNASKVIAVQAKDDTVILKADVVTLKSDTTGIYNDAFALSDTAVGVEITAGVFSLKHYAAKAAESAAQAQAAVSSVTASLYFVGAWNASGNTAPPPPVDNLSGSPMYKVTVAGVIDGITYDINDNLIWDTENSVWNGTIWTLEKWFKIDNSEAVVSVNGGSGVVVIGTADIATLDTTLTGLRTDVDLKVATLSYDADQVTLDARVKELELDLNIKMWSFIV